MTTRLNTPPNQSLLGIFWGKYACHRRFSNAFSSVIPGFGLYHGVCP